MYYIQIKKALYETLQVALLFWNSLSHTLQEWGYVVNIYDKWVENKELMVISVLSMVCGQLTIFHVNMAVLKGVINKQNQKFGQENLFTTVGRKKLEYPGINIDYSTKGKEKLSMYISIKKILDEFPLDM